MTLYERAYREGTTFGTFLEEAEKNREMWQSIAPRARELPGRWRLLAIADDWCGDAVNILPVVARLVEQVDSLELRIVSRESNAELMEKVPDQPDDQTTGPPVPFGIRHPQQLHQRRKLRPSGRSADTSASRAAGRRSSCGRSNGAS